MIENGKIRQKLNLGYFYLNFSIEVMSFPTYWDILPNADRASYILLRQKINQENQNSKNSNNCITTFEEQLKMIREFAERKDMHDWKRFLVCGICWKGELLGVNTRQLRFLIKKCKSAINSSLQRMGYQVCHSNELKPWTVFSPMIPYINTNMSELRQWTIRINTKNIKAKIEVCSKFKEIAELC